MYRIKLLFIVSLLILTSACSSKDTIAVLNDAQGPIRLEYTFKGAASVTEWRQQQLSHIAVVASERAGEVDCPWVSLSPSEYSYDPSSRKVKVEVPPATAIRIAELTNYVETDEGAADDFPIESVTIDGGQGITHYEGEQAREQFRNLKRSLHAIDYR